MRLPITQLRKTFSYDPETGRFHWLVSTNGRGGNIEVGDRAGTVTKGRRQIKHRGHIYSEHVLAWAFMTGDWPPKGLDVEHRDEDGTNNRWGNLRLATRGQNNHNRSRARKDSQSGHAGVSPRTYRSGNRVWHARIIVPGRGLVILGDFQNKDDAIKVRRAAERKYLGEFAPNRGAC